MKTLHLVLVLRTFLFIEITKPDELISLSLQVEISSTTMQENC